MEIVIIGIGKVGSALTFQLAAEEGHNITVIDILPEVVDNMVSTADVMGICGNGAALEKQKLAGVQEADLLIATTSSDELNIFCCLVGKKLGVKNTIARIRNPEYNHQLRFMREELGLSMEINPEYATAREIARMLRFPNAIKIESFSKGRAELIEYRLAEGNPLVGIPLSEINKVMKARILICAVEREGKVFIPSGSFILKAGDKIHLTAPPDALETFFRQLGIFKGRSKSVIIIGGSRISLYLAKQLTEMGMRVKLFEQDEKRCHEINELIPKATVIQGDGTDQDLLIEEGIDQVDAFVALTGIDEGNIVLAMYAMTRQVDKVIAKVNRASFIELVSSSNFLESIVSPSEITANLILQYVRAMQNTMGSNIRTLYRIVGNKVEALEFGVKESSEILDVPIMELKLKDNILIACIIRRGGAIVIPSGRDCIHAGDHVVVVVSTDHRLNDINDILR